MLAPRFHREVEEPYAGAIRIATNTELVITEGNYLLTHLEGGIAWAEKIGVFRDEAVRSRLIALFREAQGELRRRMK